MTMRSLLLRSAVLAVVLAGLAGTAIARPSDTPPYFLGRSTIDCNFNGTAVACPGSIWFIAVGKLAQSSLAPVTIYLRNQHIKLTADNVAYDLVVPNAQTFFDPNSGTATTAYSGEWATTVPASTSGNQFYAGMAWPVPCPAGLPGSVHPVSWTADFYSSKPGVTINWTCSAAAYTSFATDLSSLEVKATDDNHYPPYAVSDHAGTPENTNPNYKSFVTGGATGGGGSNFTGSLCSTQSLPNGTTRATIASWGRVKNTYR